MVFYAAPYSAISAISPALERTREFLFRPFRFWRFLKLALVACLVEGGAKFNLNFGLPPSGGKTQHAPMHVPHFPWLMSPMFVALIVAAALAGLAVWVVISYLIVRLRFAYFDCVLFMDDKIAPGWSRYHRQAMRYLGMSLCIGAVLLVALGATGWQLLMKYRPLFASMGPARTLTFGEMAPLLLTIFLIVFLLVLVLLLVDTGLSYLVLPRMALEDASIGQALSAVWNDVMAEPGQFTLFLLMRVLLPVAVMLVCGLVLIIPMVALIVLAVLIGVFLHMVLAPGSVVFLAVMGSVATVIGIGIFLPAGIAILGTLGTFVRNYALLFYGGRYPQLGRLLWPLPPEPPAFAGVPGTAPI